MGGRRTEGSTDRGREMTGALAAITGTVGAGGFASTGIAVVVSAGLPTSVDSTGGGAAVSFDRASDAMPIAAATATIPARLIGIHDRRRGRRSAGAAASALAV